MMYFVLLDLVSSSSNLNKWINFWPTKIYFCQPLLTIARPNRGRPSLGFPETVNKTVSFPIKPHQTNMPTLNFKVTATCCYTIASLKLWTTSYAYNRLIFLSVRPSVRPSVRLHLLLVLSYTHDMPQTPKYFTD